MANLAKSKALQLSAGAGLQLAALCWRELDGAKQILLITSRDTGRWILPKGWPMKGRSLADAAKIEAWEEAGVTGTPSLVPIGTYSYKKSMNRETATSLALDVHVFAVEVDTLARKYPEAGQRRRKWFDAAEAAKKVEEAQLRELILSFAGLDEADSL